MKTVAVLGATGFVGRATVKALESHGAEVRSVRAPRLTVAPQAARTAWRDLPDVVANLAARLDGCEVVICCAGNPDASAQDLSVLFGVNAGLPGVVAAAAHAAGARRLVHVSSAAVQGAAAQLDATSVVYAFSPYARSKIE